jgi:hypothetical protein
MVPIVSYISSCPLISLLKLLTSSSDIAYYGINLNQSVVLARIGYGKGATPYDTLHRTAVGNIIVQSAVCSSTFIHLDLSMLIINRATFPDSTSVYSFRTDLGVSNSSSGVQPSLQ